MVRIRVKVLDHDGDSKKGKVSKCICAANALVYKIRENRDGSVVSQIPLSAQLLLLSLAQTLGLLVGLSVSLLIVGVRV